MRTILLFCIFLYCLPVYADEISDLREEVSTLQGQMSVMQGQIKALMGEKGEKGITTSDERTSIKPRDRDPRIAFKVKTGYNAVSYQAESAGLYWRENTAGIGTSAELDARLLKPLRFNLTFDGSIPNNRDSLQVSSLLGNVFSDTRIRLYTGSPNLKYRVFDSKKVSADMSLGYEFFGTQVRQRFIQSNVSERDSIFGHGPRIGMITKFRPHEKWSFGAEAFYSSFFDVKWEITGARNAHTEGHAFRWDMGTDYTLTDRFSIGAGYRGYLLNTDLAKVNIGSGQVPYPKTETRSDLIYFSAGFNY